jgi:hypothetical protein
MMALATLSAEIIATIAVLALTNLAILTFRNPMRSGWQRSPAIQLAAEMASISAILIVVPILGAGVYGSFGNLIAGTLVLVALVVGIYVGLDHLMRMPARLKLCDEGQSPFRRDHVPASDAPMAAQTGLPVSSASDETTPQPR